MTGYTGGTVSAKIELDTSEFKKAVEQLKTEVTGLKTAFNILKGGNPLEEEVQKLKAEVDSLKSTTGDFDKSVKNIQKGGKEFAKSSKEVSRALKSEEKNLDSFVKKTKEVADANEKLNNSLKNTKQDNSQYTQIGNAASKASEALTKMHEKNIQSKAKEAQAFKKYTIEEIDLMKELNRAAQYKLKKGNTLMPIDGKYGLWGNYSSLLRKFRKSTMGLTGVWDDYAATGYKDYTTGFQKRIKELAHDLGITVSSVTNQEYKRVRDKETGKLVEYFDVSALKNNDKWLNKVHDQLMYYDSFLKQAEQIRRRSTGVLKKFFPKEIGELIKTYKKLGYEEWGKEGNPFINEFVSKKGWRKYATGKDDWTDGLIYEHQIEKATKALNTFNRMLNTTSTEAIHTKRELTETGKALEKSIALKRLSGEAYSGGSPKYGKAADLLAQEKQSAVFDGKTYYEQWRNEIRKTISELDKLKFKMSEDQRGQYYSGYLQVSNALNEQISQIIGKYEGLETITTRLKETTVGFAPVTEKTFSAATKGAEQYRERLVLIAEQTKATFETMQVELAKANAAQYKYWQQERGSSGQWDAQPLQIKGYNDYLKQDINELNLAVEKYETAIQNGARVTLEFKEQLVQLANSIKTTNTEFNRFATETDRIVNSMSRMAKANEVAAEISKISKELNHFSSISTKNKSALSGFSQQITILKDKFRVLDTAFREGEITAQTYDAELTKLAEKLKLLGSTAQQSIRELSLNNSELTRTGNNARQAGRGITSFNNGVVQTAHSGRILSNTLYQIRGALLSLKMIFTAMGGMALWGFAMDIAEGIKETFAAKNEMESQLAQNSKVGAGGVKLFNDELERTIKLFPKINKYAIGETVSSIGLEFNLNAQQMAKSFDVVAMVQSEYVRAGRKEAEAALAVKDILQGEFQRLSRETGVGEEELLAYGWSGDKSDVEGLMDALRKAAKDRHWDLFAAKATSLNDVLTILKSRFSETGAEILDTATPMIVGAFNTILDTIKGLQDAFDGLGSFGKGVTLYGGFIAALTAVGTALPMVTKGMGLADIATIGWSKSLATAILNLNKAEVAQYGFKKALTAVISGTTAAEISEVRWSKALLGRIIGVNQSILAERGYRSAIFNRVVALRNGLDVSKAQINLGKASVINLKDLSLHELTRTQKLAYMTNNIKLNEAAELSRGKAVLKTVTSFKILKTVIMGLMAINFVVWLAGVAAWCDTVKKNVDGFNQVAESGSSMLSDARKKVEDYQSALGKLTEGTAEYTKAQKNLKQATLNASDIARANKFVKEHTKLQKQYTESIQYRNQNRMKDTYKLAGMDETKATEASTGWLRRVQNGWQNIQDSLVVYDDRLYKASQHMNDHIGQMREAGVSEEKMLKYIDEYSIKSQEVAENWKKFNQGDMSSGAYALLGELQLLWIDLWNDTHFVNFWESVKQTWEDLKPTIYAIKDALGDLGHILLDFFSTKEGQIIGGIAAVGLGLTYVGLKIAPVIGKIKDVGGSLVDLGSKLKDRIKDWEIFGKKAEEANDKADGKTTSDKSTGGINGDIEGKGNKGGWWKNTKGKLLDDATSYLRAAEGIAAAMLLMSEAILLLNAPMLSLAATGYVFEQTEPQVRKGIDGLKLIAPVIAVLLPPVIAIMLIMDKAKGLVSSNIMYTAKQSALAIAVGLGLIAEAIILMVAPMLALAGLGYVSGLLGDNVQKGVEAMKVVSDSLQYLVPFIPAFAIGIGMAAIAMTGIGSIVYPVVIAGIATGLLLVSGAIIGLALPLTAISQLGDMFSDLSGVQKGAEAIKLCAEAMKYVSDAIGLMALVEWELLAYNIAHILNSFTGVSLGDLANEGGFFDQLSTFFKDFNEKVDIQKPDEGKIEAVKSASTGITAIGDAMKSVSDAMDKMPPEFRNGGQTTADTPTGQAAVENQGATSYFDQFKEPLKQLKSFIEEFNKSEDFAIEPVDTSRLEAIKSASAMIGEIKTAVDNVKAAMQGVGSAGSATAFAEGGWFGQAGYDLFHSTGLDSMNNGQGSGEYKSSLGTSLKEMEDIISDLMTFNSNISGLMTTDTAEGSTGSSSGIAESLGTMVTTVSTAIQNLSDSLSQAAPQVRENAKSIGTGIRDGMKEGIGNLTDIVVQPITSAMSTGKAYAATYAKGIGGAGRDGFKSTFKIADAVKSELDSALQAMENKKQEFHDKGYALGNASAEGFREGNDMHSPGIMARSMFAELGYMSAAFDDVIVSMPNQAYTLAETMATNFNPSLDIGGISVDELSQFQSGLDTVSSMAANTDMQTSLAFTNMNTTVGTTMQGMSATVNTSFNNIANNATSSYGRIVNTTRVSLANMQSQTTKNINAIKTSWRNMQTALIQSAENIRSETSAKIHTLQSNMASFWQKVQNPALLLGAAGSNDDNRSSPRRGRFIRAGTGTRAKLPPMAGTTPTGIKTRSVRANDKRPSKEILEYLECLLNGGRCAAGGWNFNWSPDIKRALLHWNTHFGEIYDPYLTVGKFENDDFPVRGNAEIAKRYIEDAIKQTSYSYYFDSHYGSPLEAWNAGAFNCVDGAMVAIGFANAFGFPGGYIGYGTWDGTGHGFAVIPGLGIIDATAIQKGYGLTSPKVNYPSAGSPSRSSGSRPPKMGDTHNYNGDVNIHIHTDGKDVTVDERKIDNETGRKIIDLLGINPSTGR